MTDFILMEYLYILNDLLQGFRASGKPRSHLYSTQSRSLPPQSVGDFPDADFADMVRTQHEPILEEDSLDDEVFFDNKSHGTSALDLRVPGDSDMVASAGLSPASPLIVPSLDTGGLTT